MATDYGYFNKEKMMVNGLPRLLYTKEEAAEILAIDVSAVDGLLRNDAAPRHIIRGKLRFTMEDLETIVDQFKSE